MGQGLRHLWPTEADSIRAFIKLGQRGLKVDLPRCEELAAKAHEEMFAILDRIGFNPKSKLDLEKALLVDLELPVVEKTKNGNPSFNKKAMAEYDVMLDALGNPLAQDILAYRGWQQADSFYYTGYQNMVSPDGRVRPNYKPTGTRTGRPSCEQPNLQQIPRRSDKPWSGPVKSLFIPTDEEHILWTFDYAALEFRFALLYANDVELIERVNNGEDFHQATASMIKERAGLEVTRYDAKQMNFAIVYGAGVAKLVYMMKATRDKSTGIATEESVRELLDAYNAAFPGFRPASYRAQETAKNRGYIRYWTGRHRHFNSIWNKGQEHKAFNSACQGGGAEVVKRAMIQCMKKIDNPQCKMVLQVHDELAWEIRKDKLEYYIPRIRECMEDFKLQLHSNTPFVKFHVEDKEWAT